MENFDLMLDANFITNIFMRMAGIYNGLFSSEALGVTEETAGYIDNLMLSRQGSYTATLYWMGPPQGISGIFTPGLFDQCSSPFAHGEERDGVVVCEREQPPRDDHRLGDRNQQRLANGMP